jgi:Tol biopolymer transport system component
MGEGAGVRLLAVLSVWMVTLVFAPAGSTTYPGANGKIAFVGTRDGDAEVFVMSADGSGQTQLTANLLEDREPRWSPDGTKIAWESGLGNHEIWVMNADGSGKTQITSNGADNGAASWSRDGSKLAFSSSQSGNYEIWVMNADGSGQIQLTSTSAPSQVPAWSPDGTRIAFQRYGADYDIWVMNADGTGQTQLTSTSDRDTSVSWSPDSSKLLFRRDLGYGNGWGEVFEMNPDGTGVTNLTNTPTFFEDQGSFSPDGTKIVMFSNEGGGEGDILLMNPDGTGRTNLTNAAGYDTDPDWQPAVGFAFAGFFSPVDNPPVFNRARAGGGIPVKFSLGGNKGSSIFAAGYPRSERITCDGSASLDDIEQTVTAGGSSLSYDATTDRYTYTWKTDRAWATSCRKLTLRLSDGSDHVAYFTFTK